MSKSNLKYFLNLIDDESDEIRTEILSRIKEYGIELEEDLLNHKDLISPEKYQLLIPIIEENRRIWIIDNWNSWFDLDSDNEKIESALSILSKFHYGLNSRPDLSYLLDELAEEFMNKIPYGDELDLSFFLFKEKELSGAKEDYHNPFNSDAVYSIIKKKGLPITLSLIYLLVGSRLGFDIKGCNYPGHFMAKFDFDGETIIVDCFANGKVFFENEIDKLLIGKRIDIIKSIIEDTPAELIIRRVLNNLSNSYSMLNDYTNAKFFSGLSDKINL